VSEAGLGPLIGSGKDAEVFVCGAHVAKLYRSPAAKRSAFREGAVLAVVHSLGMPVPAVHAVRAFDERWAVVMDRAVGVPFTEAMLSDRSCLPAFLTAMVALHRRIHEKPGRHLPSLRARLAGNFSAVEVQLGARRRNRLTEVLAELPGDDRLCHGDFHPWNIIGDIGNETVVDWLDAASGPPAADVCRSWLLIASQEPGIADAYVDAYCAAAGLARTAVLAWLPVTAAARLAENVPEEADRLIALADEV